jgi:hypothetical protein
MNHFKISLDPIGKLGTHSGKLYNFPASVRQQEAIREIKCCGFLCRLQRLGQLLKLDACHWYVHEWAEISCGNENWLTHRPKIAVKRFQDKSTKVLRKVVPDNKGANSVGRNSF